jgi:signal transduction histidine kinase
MANGSIENNSIRREVILKFWPLASLVLITFVVVSVFIQKDYVTAIIHFINLILLSIVLPLCLRNNEVLLACNTLAGIGMVTIQVFLFTGGPARAGFWWSIVYVIGAFLVTPKRWAVFWITFYFMVTVIFLLLSFTGLIKIAYRPSELLHMLFVYVITFGFVYYFNQVLEYYLRLADKKSEELVKVNKELLSVNKELEDFAYVASHDLQEPIQTISNFTGLLIKKYSGVTPETDQYFYFISAASSKMKELIKDLLELSRIGRNRMISAVDCNALLKEVIIQMQASIKDSNAVITYSSLPLVKGNELEFKQLFQNLISNAIKFRKKNGFPRIKISAEEKETEYLFAIEDNGIGIEEEYKNKIFVVFQRLHTSDEYPGTGIGLATCKKIAATHNGKIWVESKLGEGSIFYVTIAKDIE